MQVLLILFLVNPLFAKAPAYNKNDSNVWQQQSPTAMEAAAVADSRPVSATQIATECCGTDVVEGKLTDPAPAEAAQSAEAPASAGTSESET